MVEGNHCIDFGEEGLLLCSCKASQTFQKPLINQWSLNRIVVLVMFSGKFPIEGLSDGDASCFPYSWGSVWDPPKKGAGSETGRGRSECRESRPSTSCWTRRKVRLWELRQPKWVPPQKDLPNIGTKVHM